MKDNCDAMKQETDSQMKAIQRLQYDRDPTQLLSHIRVIIIQ